MRTTASLVDEDLVGRNPLIEALEHAVTRSDLHGAFVFGEAGMGKTALARHLVDRTLHSAAPFLIHPGPALSNAPYAALAPFLGRATARDIESSLSVLRILISFFREESKGRPVLLVVDDAHEVDDDSSHVLSQLVSSRTVRLVAFSRPQEPVSEELVSLCREGLLARFEVGPLDAAEVAEVCTKVLGGELVRGTGERLWEESGGNPLFLRTLLDQSLADGALTETAGVWQLSAEELRVPASLADLVRGICLRLPPQERKAFEALALAEPVPFSALSGITDATAVPNLLEAGLIMSMPGHPAFAVPTHRLYGRIVRGLVPAGRSAVLRAELAAGSTPIPTVGPGRIRHLNWALDCGETVSDAELIEGARLAHRYFDLSSSVRFASAVTGPEHATAARVERARVELARMHLPEAEDLLRGTLEAAGQLEVLAAAAVLTVRLRLFQGRPLKDISTLADRWSAVLKSKHSAAADPPEVDLLRCFIYNLEGRYADAETRLRAIGEDEAAGELNFALTQSLLGEALGATGRGIEGKALTGSGLALVRTDPGLFNDFHAFTLTRHLLVLIHSGEFAEAEAALQDYARRPARDYAFTGGALAALDALLEVRRGRFRLGMEKLGPALEALRRSDKELLLPYALAVAALTASALGRADRAEALTAEFAAQAHRGSRPLALLGQAFTHAALLPSSNREHHLDRLRGLAATAAGKALSTVEKDILEILVALGDEESADRLAALTGTMEGREAAVLNTYAAAVASGDPERLAVAGDKAELSQKHLVAADAAYRAMRLLSGAGDRRTQRELLQVARRRRQRLEGCSPVLLGDAEEPTKLTAREREIASLALDGASNRAIAAALTVSPRTVEGHLYRIYAKLGITRREELTAEYESIVRPE
jgi:DNA-binding CsgD family transcriptional regulator/tetratricopeptide (TPR) repeat protein